MDRRTKTLALTAALAVLVPVASAGARSDDGPAARAAATYTVRLKDSFFSPASVRARGRTTIRFVWAGKLAHNLVGRNVPKSYARARVRSTPLTRTYGRGSYTFNCTIHPGMSFRLRVR